MNVSVPPKQIPIYIARTEKGDVTHHIIVARRRKNPCCSFIKSPKIKQIKLDSGNFQNRYTLLERSQIKSLEVKYKEQPKSAIDGTKHTETSINAA